MGIVRPSVHDILILENYTSSPEIIKNYLQEVLSEDMRCSQVSAPADNDNITKKRNAIAFLFFFTAGGRT